MTKKALALGGGFALLLLVAGFVILKRTDSEPSAAARKAAGASSAPVTSIGRAQPVTAHRPSALHADESVTADRSGSASDEPAELEVAPIKKAYIQREDGSLRAKDAPPPLIRSTTIDGIRAAVAPAVQHCIAEGLAHVPEQRALDTHPSVSIVYTASAAAGSVTVANAAVTINGTQDDTLLACVEASYKAIRIRAPSDQPDGEGKVIATFDYQ